MPDAPTTPTSIFCRKCSYNLRGITESGGGEGSARCPECRHPFNPSDPSSYLPAPKSLFLRLGPTGFLALYFAAMPLIGLTVLSFNVKHITTYLTDDPARGLAIYIAGFIFLSGLALLPTWPQSLIGGWAFHLWPGIPAALFAVTIGSTIGTELARAASGHRIEALIDERPKWRAVRTALIGGTFWKTLGLVALIRLPPNSPFALVNLILGSTRTNRIACFVGTMIGILPRTAVTVYIGTTIQKLTEESITQAPPSWLFIAGLVLIITVVAIIGRIAKRALDRVTDTTQTSVTPPASPQ